MDLKWNWRGKVRSKETWAFKKAQKARYFRVRKRSALWKKTPKNNYVLDPSRTLSVQWLGQEDHRGESHCRGLVPRAFHQPGTSRKTRRVRVFLCTLKGSLSSIFWVPLLVQKSTWGTLCLVVNHILQNSPGEHEKKFLISADTIGRVSMLHVLGEVSRRSWEAEGEGFPVGSGWEGELEEIF